MKKKYSVAMATYNGEKYILEQLNSIINQTLKPDEIVICDDCSSDRTAEIIKDLANNTEIPIFLHQNISNLGFRKNFEQCIQLCQYEIVFLCDQDDVWLPTKAEKLMGLFYNDERLVYAFSNSYVTNENLSIVTHDSWFRRWDSMDRQQFFDVVQTRIFPLGYEIAVKRSIIDEIVPFMADHDGWISLCAPIFGNVKALNENLVYYRRHNTTTSSAFHARKSYWKMIRSLFSKTYREHFVWYDCELLLYKKVASLSQQHNSGLDLTELMSHLSFLEMLDQAKNKTFVGRIRSLLALHHSGAYQKYRGNRNTLIADCVFMFLNSFKPKHRR